MSLATRSRKSFMAGQQQGERIGFKTVQLFKDQILGIGSYGKVCKAECDDLLCAAKVIHETLFDPTVHQVVAPQREHRLPMRRFEQECEFLSTIRHPNIIQYLGMYQDPDTRLPVLLMELMHDSLTHFLESSPQPISYHIQINISHDITLALSFLHSNGIVHRDLSSNNVLMIGNIQAKLTDFGMARLADINPREIHLTFTMCPCTDVYMPPEAVKDKPVYTEKIDCFSFGVIAVQIMTRLFPEPGDRRKEVKIENVGILEKRVPECERRQNHISKIDPNHPLLATALDCLKDKGADRPSAEELCGHVASLKQNHRYHESVRVSKEQGCENTQREELLRQEHAQQIEGLQQTIQSQVVRLEEKDQVIIQQDETIAAGLQEIQELREHFREQIHRLEHERNRKDHEILALTTQLEQITSEKEMAMVQISELELQLGKKDNQQQSMASSGAEGKENIKLKWREGERAPCKLSKYFVGETAVAVDGNSVYIVNKTKIFVYDASTLAWSHLADSSFRGCALAVVGNLLTLIGGKGVAPGLMVGWSSPNITNKLFSLTRKGRVAKLTEELPPMPTKRYGVCTVCTETALIVAGGKGYEDFVATTEVLNTTTLQWSTADNLPQPTFFGSLLKVSHDQIYMVGAYDQDNYPIKSVYAYSLNALLQSCKPQSLGGNLASFLAPSEIWRRVTDVPTIDSAYVSFCGQLLAIGGGDSPYKPTTAVHLYDHSTNSWEVISHITTPRRRCYAAVLPDNQLIVVGGQTDSSFDTETGTVEIATIPK